jgi:ComF family protein
MIAGLLEAIFPPRCGGCAEVGRAPFCRICQGALEPAEPFGIAGAEAARALYRYGGPLAIAVHHMKYGKRAELARALGSLLPNIIDPLGPFEGLIPVPLGRKRLAERGFNQALELARGTGMRVYTDALKRIHETPPQVALSRIDRQANLAGAFSGNPGRVRRARVALIDDVVTTGATARAATAALLNAGARSVVVIALCRADAPMRNTVELRGPAK